MQVHIAPPGFHRPSGRGLGDRNSRTGMRRMTLRVIPAILQDQVESDYEFGLGIGVSAMFLWRS
jgi:hypothetical protein